MHNRQCQWKNKFFLRKHTLATLPCLSDCCFVARPAACNFFYFSFLLLLLLLWNIRFLLQQRSALAAGGYRSFTFAAGLLAWWPGCLVVGCAIHTYACWVFIIVGFYSHEDFYEIYIFIVCFCCRFVLRSPYLFLSTSLFT